MVEPVSGRRRPSPWLIAGLVALAVAVYVLTILSKVL